MQIAVIEQGNQSYFHKQLWGLGRYPHQKMDMTQSEMQNKSMKTLVSGPARA